MTDRQTADTAPPRTIPPAHDAELDAGLELVLLARDVAATLAADVAVALGALNAVRPDGRWHLTIADDGSRDTTLGVAHDIASRHDAIDAVALGARLGRVELRERFVSTPATTVAFARVGADAGDLASRIAILGAVGRVGGPVQPTAPARGWSRRTLLATAGGAGLVTLLAACGSSSKASSGSTASTAAGTPGSTASTGADSSVPASTAAGSSAASAAAALAPEMTQGPYYLDLDLVRSNVVEDRPGAPLALTLRVVDPSNAPLAGAAVDIWHCDSEGTYSGFVSQSMGANGGSGGQGAPPPGGGGGGQGGPPPGGAGGGGAGGQGGPPPGGAGAGAGAGGGGAGGQVVAATPTDPSTFLRGTQVTGADGAVTFETIYPGWYQGRTVHIHVMVHAGGKAIHTGQLFFDDAFTDQVYASKAPYSSRPERTTRNSSDGIFGGGGAQSTLTVKPAGDGFAATMVMGVRTA